MTFFNVVGNLFSARAWACLLVRALTIKGVQGASSRLPAPTPPKETSR
jgi:hypothetical protein